MWALLLPVSLAAPAVPLPAGYSSVGERAGCTLALGPDEADGVVPMWAACDWDDTTPATLASALSAPDRYGAIWPNILASRVLSRDGETLRVWQKHDLPAFADREVVVDWRVLPIPGGQRFTWTTAPVDWALVPGDERCMRYEARWDIVALPDGGARVVHETHYASGTLPPWLVRPFLGRELAAAVEALHQYVTSR